MEEHARVCVLLLLLLLMMMMKFRCNSSILLRDNIKKWFWVHLQTVWQVTEAIGVGHEMAENERWSSIWQVASLLKVKSDWNIRFTHLITTITTSSFTVMIIFFVVAVVCFCFVFRIFSRAVVFFFFWDFSEEDEFIIFCRCCQDAGITSISKLQSTLSFVSRGVLFLTIKLGKHERSGVSLLTEIVKKKNKIYSLFSSEWNERNTRFLETERRKPGSSCYCCCRHCRRNCVIRIPEFGNLFPLKSIFFLSFSPLIFLFPLRINGRPLTLPGGQWRVTSLSPPRLLIGSRPPPIERVVGSFTAAGCPPCPLPSPSLFFSLPFL